MIATNPASGASMSPDGISRLGGEMVELAFLLPDWQAKALEAAAHGRGLTTGQMMRCIIRDFFTKFAQPHGGAHADGG